MAPTVSGQAHGKLGPDRLEVGQKLLLEGKEEVSGKIDRRAPEEGGRHSVKGEFRDQKLKRPL